jgi:hypothetical protein
MEPNHETNPSPEGLRLNEALARMLWDRTYHGKRVADGLSEVWVEETSQTPEVGAMVCRSTRRCLPLRLDVMSHSPTGFEWGYGGSGPAQLALALLLDALEDEDLALRHYQEFKRQKVAGWGDTWSISRRKIWAFVEAQSE